MSSGSSAGSDPESSESLAGASTSCPTKRTKKSVLFDKVEVYHFNRSQGFCSIPAQGGSTLGMKRNHFLMRNLTVDLYEEVRRRTRREILLKIKMQKDKERDALRKELQDLGASPTTSSSPSPPASTISVTDTANTVESDEEESFSECSDISDSELNSDSCIFLLQPMSVKLRRSLLRASGVGRIDPREKVDCEIIRESRSRTGCKCVNQCIPDICECSLLGVNCHVDRVSFPCGCKADGCQNPQGRTEFDVKRVKGHLVDKLDTSGIG